MRPLVAGLFVLALSGLGAAVAEPSRPASKAAASTASDLAYEQISQLMSPRKKERRRAAKALIAAAEPRVLPGLVDAYFFIPAEHRAEALEVLRALSGEDVGKRYFDWVEIVGKRTDLEPLPGYREHKVALLERIDRRYRRVFSADAPIRIRLEEIVWGGVPLAGIPALEQPQKVAAAGARSLRENDSVLGVSIGERHHAYPLKVLSWHEMANDTVAGEPIAISYCTLCGSAVVYSTRRADGGAVILGTSGLLYRSNKLMFDQETLSLWSNITGEAVVGRRAAESARLEMLPATVTTWQAWRTRHPDTTVMRLDPNLGNRYGFRYEEGAADAARAGVSFPVWLADDRFPPKTVVLALRLDGRAKAYELEAVRAARLLNDRLGDHNLVVLADDAGTVRAYERGSHTFAIGAAGDLTDETGSRWLVLEQRLRRDDGSASLARLPGHLAFWFGWYGFYPDTEVFPDR